MNEWMNEWAPQPPPSWIKVAGGGGGKTPVACRRRTHQPPPPPSTTTTPRLRLPPLGSTAQQPLCCCPAYIITPRLDRRSWEGGTGTRVGVGHTCFGSSQPSVCWPNLIADENVLIELILFYLNDLLLLRYQSSQKLIWMIFLACSMVN